MGREGAAAALVFSTGVSFPSGWALGLAWVGVRVVALRVWHGIVVCAGALPGNTAGPLGGWVAVVAGAAVAVPGWALGPVIAWSWGGTVGCGTGGGPACGGAGDGGGCGRCGGVGVGFGTLSGDWYWSPWDSTLYQWGLSRWQMHTPCTVTCEVSGVVLFGEMYTPPPLGQAR